MLPEYSRVKLIADAHAHEGAYLGMVGYVIEVYGDGNCEVEFSDEVTGTTLVQLVVAESEVVPYPE